MRNALIFNLQNLTVRNISNKLEISEPAVYRHFLNKAEIVKAVIRSFNDGIEIDEALKGIDGVFDFAQKRINQVSAKPDLAKVMFAEEIFMDNSEISNLMLEMMHKHKKQLAIYFQEAQQNGEISAEISENSLFRIVFGAVRLLIKQWGVSGYKFNLEKEGSDLLKSLRLLL